MVGRVRGDGRRPRGAHPAPVRNWIFRLVLRLSVRPLATGESRFSSQRTLPTPVSECQPF
ncbi:hypothetical protein Afil01_44580 [Actinorhabdospora filicis]|uniref:Uncharacterized protein n=1 Tax=Actinorhabdospora filicis TaxID=1785913 RepID=A0A9W6SPA0_9ACTN|nr:hypothetical protein Afil01_44580 [Actinorhabdospora filicis]